MKIFWIRAICLFVWLAGFNAFANATETEFLPADQAFQFNYQQYGERVVVNFDVEHGYYLYKDKIHITAEGQELVPSFSITPKIKQDEFFGEVAVFENNFTLEFVANSPYIKLQYQGCAKAGLCYPPQIKTLALTFDSPETAKNIADNTVIAKADKSLVQEDNLSQQGLFVTLVGFFIIGVGLSFTPCVLPMAPILSSIITAKKQPDKKWHGLSLSIAYVLGMASFYSVSGVLIALLGAQFNLQLWMQTPVVSIIFAIVFVVFALTMLDVLVLKMPQKLEDYLGNKQQASGGYFTTYITGGIASLALSPCVTAPMASLLVYIAATGDAVLGGLSLFVLSLGMSLPLLLLGAGMGQLLPKAGSWMMYVKYFFAATMLAMAVWLIGRLLAADYAMYLWSAFLIWLTMQVYGMTNGFAQTKIHGYFVSAVFLYALWVVNQPSVLAINNAGANISQSAHTSLFRRFDSVQALSTQLQQATEQQIVILDIYADWCASCKKIERDVFSVYQPTGAAAQFQYYQLDLTVMDALKQAQLSDWQVIAPPAVVAIQNGQVIARKQGEFNLSEFSAWLADLPN